MWRSRDVFIGAACVLPLLSCASTATEDTSSGPQTDTSEDALYAITATVFGPDDSATSYVVLSKSLDVDPLELSQGREFPGRVKIATVDGKLFVRSDSEPTLTRFSINDALEWREDSSLSFAPLGLKEADFDTLVNKRTAYMRLDESGFGRVVWDPKKLEIQGTREQSNVAATKDGLTAYGYGLGFEFESGAPPIRVFTYSDDDYFDRGTTTTIAVYDAVTHEETRTFDLDCPATDETSRDEAGNIYLSNWDYWPTRALYHLGPPACVRRLKPDATLDAQWKPDLTQWTGGRHIMAWHYMRDGKAIGNVLHHEELEAQGADFGGAYDPNVYDEIANGEHYRPWIFDLNTETAKPIDGISRILSALQVIELDGRTFALLPYDNWTRMEIYEIDAEAGTAARRSSVGAYIDGWVRIR